VTPPLVRSALPEVPRRLSATKVMWVLFSVHVVQVVALLVRYLAMPEPGLLPGDSIIGHLEEPNH